MATRLWYVNVFVRDFDRAVDFYQNQLGLPLRFKDGEFGYVSFETGAAGLALARVDPEAANADQLAGRFTGVGLGVPDLDKAYEELRGRGVEFTMPPAKQPWGGVLAILRDPDGNELYLDQLRDE